VDAKAGGACFCGLFYDALGRPVWTIQRPTIGWLMNMKGFGRKRLWPGSSLKLTESSQDSGCPALSTLAPSVAATPACTARYILYLWLCYDLSAEFHFLRVDVTKFYVQGRLQINCVWFSKTCKSSGGFAGHNTNLIKAHELHPELVHI
jgi:hypothetical protein